MHKIGLGVRIHGLNKFLQVGSIPSSLNPATNARNIPGNAKTMNKLIAVAVFVCLLGATNQVEAEYIIVANETQAGVTFTGTGSIDSFAGLSITGLYFNYGNQIRPDTPRVSFNHVGQGLRLRTGVTASGTFGSGGNATATSGSGGLITISDNGLFLADGYQTGSSLDATMTFENETFDSLGITRGASVTWSWGDAGVNGNGDFVSFSAVPEPTSFLLFGSLGLMSFRRRRR